MELDLNPFFGLNKTWSRNPPFEEAYTLEDFSGWEPPTNRPFRKENDLNQTSMIMFQPLIFRGVLGGSSQSVNV